MNPAATKWVISTAVISIGICLIIFFVFRNKISSDIQSENILLQSQIKILNQQNDSVVKLNSKRSDTIKILSLQIDTLNGRYGIIKNLLVAENSDLSHLRQQMNNLNLSSIDKYNADSIIRYFNNNFADSTNTK